MANTVSPASAQLTLACQPRLADIIPEYYNSGLFPVLLCPSTLFTEIIRINTLRAQAAATASSLPEACDTPAPTAADLRHRAEEVLRRVLAFCPQAWADCNKDKHASSSPAPSENDGHDSARLWLLLGLTYQSATALYCIASLQSLGLLPRRDGDDNDEVASRRAEHRHQLMKSLREALVAPELKLWLMWPLVVAGMDAGAGEATGDDGGAGGKKELREYVGRELGKMALSLGTPLPLTARGALERFWSRVGGGWDECFDRPYAFVT